MELFHVSFKNYAQGQILDTNDICNLYQRDSMLRGKSWVNDEFDSLKPSHLPSRRTSFYAFENLECIGKFISIINKTPGEIQSCICYKVEMLNPGKCPFILTEHLFLLKKEYPKKHEIINEYWNPIKKWSLYEYLSNKMLITKRITFVKKDSEPHEYRLDKSLAERIWPITPR